MGNWKAFICLNIESFIHLDQELFLICCSQTWRVEMNLFTKNIRGFVDFGKQAEPKNPCMQISLSKNEFDSVI